MGTDQGGSWSGSEDFVTKRLYATMVVFFGVICISGGYWMGHSQQIEVGRKSELGLLNLTLAAENMYKKAKRISFKTMHRNYTEKISEKLLDIFNCTLRECEFPAKLNVIALLRACVNKEAGKLLKYVNTANEFLDSLKKGNLSETLFNPCSSIKDRN